MRAYKLFRIRRDGSIGSLFIHRKHRLELGRSYAAENHPTVGYAKRPGFHAAAAPIAPHLKTVLKNGEIRKWFEVDIDGVTELKRPACQGTTWYIAKRMKVVRMLKCTR